MDGSFRPKDSSRVKRKMVNKAGVILIPFPATGHLPATIEFANRLIDIDRRISMVTILSLKLPFSLHADAYTKSIIAASPPSVQLIELPELEDAPLMELLTGSPEAYIYAFVKKSMPLIRKTIETVLLSLGLDSVHVAGLILDFFCAELIDIGDEFGLPSYIFLTSGAGFLGLMQYLPRRHSTISTKFVKNSGEEGLSIPGFVNPVPATVLPRAVFIKDGYDAYAKLGKRFLDAKGILVNTFPKLEPCALEYFGHGQNYPPVYPIGPVLSLKSRPNPDLDPAQHQEIMKWLDDQPESSVVFVCFGSMARLRAPQSREIARGLELSGYRFLWCLRAQPPEKEAPEDDPLPEGFSGRVAGRGMMCGWAPQVEVLAHKAVGGFVSHCGWNSVLESLWFGVPIATWPMHAEQQLNAFLLVKEIGLAKEMKVDYRAHDGELLMGGEIAGAIRSLMESDTVVRKKVKEMAELARKAVMDGGDSFVALERFTRDIIRDNV